MAGNEYTPNLEDGVEMVIQVDDSHDQENGHPVDSGVTHTTIQVLCVYVSLCSLLHKL